MHRNEILHRDLKPSNILIDFNNHVKKLTWVWRLNWSKRVLKCPQFSPLQRLWKEPVRNFTGQEKIFNLFSKKILSLYRRTHNSLYYYKGKSLFRYEWRKRKIWVYKIRNFTFKYRKSGAKNPRYRKPIVMHDGDKHEQKTQHGDCFSTAFGELRSTVTWMVYAVCAAAQWTTVLIVSGS